MLKRATARSKAKTTKSTSLSSSSALAPSTTATHNNNTSTSSSSSSILFPNTTNDPTNIISSSIAASSSSSSSQQPQPPDDEIIERIRLKIHNAHVFKLPPKPTSGGWRGGDWRDKVWQGILKVVERGDNTAVLLVDAQEEKNIFAVCPIRHNISIDTTNTSGGGSGTTGSNLGNGVDRCIDSSRYFVLRIQNAEGRHMYIGLAFNERNDAFDFNTALEDSRREKEVERKLALGSGSSSSSSLLFDKKVDYTMKEGEKIHVSIPKLGGGSGGADENSPTKEEGDNIVEVPPHSSSAAATRRREAKKSPTSASSSSSSLPWSSLSNKKGGGVLKPSSKDTPSRLA